MRSIRSQGNLCSQTCNLKEIAYEQNEVYMKTKLVDVLHKYRS